MRRLFIFLFVFAFCGQICAQKDSGNPLDPTVTLDLDTGTFSSTFPFDQYFTLRITSKTPLLNKVEIRRARYHKKKIDSDALESSELERFNDSISQIEKEAGSTDKIFKLTTKGKDTYEARILPLFPNKGYEVVLRRKLTDQHYEAFITIKELLDAGKDDKAKEVYASKIKPGFALPKRFEHPFPAPEFSEIKQFVNTKVRLIDSNNFVKLPSSIDTSTIKSISLKMQAKKISTDQFSQIFSGFIPAAQIEMDSIYMGITTFGSPQKVKSYEYGKREKNLSQSLALVKMLEAQLNKLLVFYASDSLVTDFYEKKFLTLKKSLQENVTQLKKHKAVTSTAINSKYYYPIVITNTSGTASDKTNKVTYLVSDFGFVNAVGGDQFDEDKWKYIGRPYFGLNWHVGGYLKGKRNSQLARKRFWNMVSVSVGVTLGDIDEGGYEDFFSELSPSLGLNVRLTRDVRIGAGGLLVRKNRNPIIDAEGAAVLPYVSVSFDYKVLGDLIIATRIFK